MGKGSHTRPIRDPKGYREEYERVFGKKRLNNEEDQPERDPYWVLSGHRGEWECPHGVGHGNHIHGCDGCCKRDDFPGRKENP